MDKQDEIRNQSMQFYLRALAQELGLQLVPYADAHSIRLILGAVREQHGKPFALPNDKNGEHLP